MTWGGYESTRSKGWDKKPRQEWRENGVHRGKVASTWSRQSEKVRGTEGRKKRELGRERNAASKENSGTLRAQLHRQKRNLGDKCRRDPPKKKDPNP